MIAGGMGAVVVVVESVGDPFRFTSECDQVANWSSDSGGFYVLDKTFVAGCVYKAIFIFKTGGS